MSQLLNPNVAYVLLMIGSIIAMLALLSPGTGLLEIGAIFTILVAGYIIINLPVQWWALTILILSFIPLIFAARSLAVRQSRLLLIASYLLLLVGSAFLFRPINTWIAIHPVIILLMTTLVTGVSWYMMRKIYEANHNRKVMDPDQLIGMVGLASSDIKGQGAVYVNGESWTAVSGKFVPSGSSVRILHRNGLVLEVEPLGHSREESHV